MRDLKKLGLRLKNKPMDKEKFLSKFPDSTTESFNFNTESYRFVKTNKNGEILVNEVM